MELVKCSESCISRIKEQMTGGDGKGLGGESSLIRFSSRSHFPAFTFILFRLSFLFLLLQGSELQWKLSRNVDRRKRENDTLKLLKTHFQNFSFPILPH
jgi:hypothetical protein